MSSSPNPHIPLFSARYSDRFDEEQRQRAALIHQTLQRMKQGVRAGRSIADIEREAADQLRAAGFEPDYAELRRGEDLKRPDAGETRGLVALIAARLGRCIALRYILDDQPRVAAQRAAEGRLPAGPRRGLLLGTAPTAGRPGA